MAKRKTSNPSKDMAKQQELPGMQLDWLDRVLPVFFRYQNYILDFIGIVLIAIALLTLLALIGLTSGAWISPWANFLDRWLGFGSIFVVFAFASAGLLTVNRKREPFSRNIWWRVIALEFSAFAAVTLFAMIGGASLERAEQGLDGGFIGWGIIKFMDIFFVAFSPGLAKAIQSVILLLVMILGAFYGLRLFAPSYRLVEQFVAGRSKRKPREIPVPVAGVVSDGEASEASLKRQKRKVSPEYRKKFKVNDKLEDNRIVPPPPRDERLPDLTLLQSDRGVKANERHINLTAGLIEQTLAEFGIPSNVVGFQVGPTITQFAVEPGYIQKPGVEGEEGRQKVRVSQISALQRDLALALSAKRLRIQAPVPGYSYVGIEVPNERAAVVHMRSILESESFFGLKSQLAVALGRDVSGQPVVADLARMPHLLIAGTTGSGKSVCVAALTICLAMNNSPKDLRLVMIDPKMVEMVRFNGLPHLYGKVETDIGRSGAVLRWVVVEMERRYKLLEVLRSRDIESYNKKAARRKEHEHLPKIVVLIDELADLMMNAAEQTEAHIVRLAQMARAVGIHLVVATQRPSTDVVTGLIKANFPARLSFAVASAIDSRVIIDMAGAEALLGNGDMLFMPPETGLPVRSQGVMVTDQEVEKVIAYWQEHWQEDAADEQSPWEMLIEAEAMLADRDELVERAIGLIEQTGKASASMMQRRLRVGYPRAARLMDELEDLGVIGPSQGGGRPREILIGFDEEEEA